MSIGDESWVEIVRASGHRLGPPCRASHLADLVFRLGTEVPQDLQRLYRLGNGVFDEPGQWWVIWPLDRVTETCSVAWADGSLPTNLIAFGDDGTGNPFCVARGATSSVVRWSWIDGDAEVDEGTFADFLSHWITRRHGHRSTTVTHEQEHRFAVFVEQLNLIERLKLNALGPAPCRASPFRHHCREGRLVQPGHADGIERGVGALAGNGWRDEETWQCEAAVGTATIQITANFEAPTSTSLSGLTCSTPASVYSI